jgi:hypothetical protein
VLSRVRSTTEILTSRRMSDSEIAKQLSADDRVHNYTFRHRIAEQLNEHDRVAFSLKNSTGDLVRVHEHTASDARLAPITIFYLEHSHLMPVQFPATESVINNLRSLELPFQGDQKVTYNQRRLKSVIDLEIDVQVPGFRWVKNISFDKSGKHFVQLFPRSQTVDAKIREDWRLRNALHILTEVRSINGGRRLSIKSPFEIINKTNHPIFIGKF